MAAPHHNRIRFEGTIVGAERWSISCAYHPKTLGMPPITSYANMRQLAEAIGGLNSGRVFPVSWHQKLSTAVALTTIRVEYINQAGRLQQVAAYELPTAQAGVGSMKCPPQTSMVVSLRTGRPGRSYRGRMYLPSLAAGISSTDARISNAECQTMATEGAVFLKQVGAAIAGAGYDLWPQVASNAAGVLTEVTEVQVGDVLDTQRRRRSSLAEQVSRAVL